MYHGAKTSLSAHETSTPFDILPTPKPQMLQNTRSVIFFAKAATFEPSSSHPSPPSRTSRALSFQWNTSVIAVELLHLRHGPVTAPSRLSGVQRFNIPALSAFWPQSGGQKVELRSSGDVRSGFLWKSGYYTFTCDHQNGNGMMNMWKM